MHRLTACCILASVYAAVKPHGHLLKYLARLTEEQQANVLSKLAAGGYADPQSEAQLLDLSDHDLKKLGVELHALRFVLRRAFALSGRSSQMHTHWGAGRISITAAIQQQGVTVATKQCLVPDGPVCRAMYALNWRLMGCKWQGFHRGCMLSMFPMAQVLPRLWCSMTTMAMRRKSSF